MDGEGDEVHRDAASFDLSGTAAQSEYVIHLAGVQAWMQFVRRRSGRPTTLWAFTDNRIVEELAQEASQLGEGTAILGNWPHLGPLHAEALKIYRDFYREVRAEDYVVTVQWLSRRNHYIGRVDREARRVTYRCREARRIENSLFTAYAFAVTLVNSAEPEEQELWRRC